MMHILRDRTRREVGPSTIPTRATRPCFAHEPLKHPAVQIRLLRITPGFDDDDDHAEVLRCELRAHNLDDNPPYQALSYTWGTSGERCPIKINGEAYQVGRNLYDFLIKARRNVWLTGKTWVWIDQVCIDQDNVPERNAQVCCMQRIYREAEGVLIWLGDTGSGGDEAMRAWSDASQIRNDLRDQIKKNPYWARLWVAQEIHLARRICILCSDSRLQWEDIQGSQASWMDGEFGLRVLWIKLVYFDKMIDSYNWTASREVVARRVSEQGRSSQASNFNLHEALKESLGARCLDPRDHVYGLMGLVTTSERVDVDYSKSTLEVFLDTLHKVLPWGTPYRSEVHQYASLLLQLAVKMKLLEDVEETDLSKLYPHMDGPFLAEHEHGYDHTLLVIIEMFCRIEKTKDFASLDPSASYVDPEYGSFETRMTKLIGHDDFYEWRHDIRLPELETRFRLYANIIKTRASWSKSPKQCCIKRLQEEMSAYDYNPNHYL